MKNGKWKIKASSRKARLHNSTFYIFNFTLALAFALVGCASIPKAKDVSLGGMYANAATETVAIGKAKITTLPESIESFVAHYSEDTAWLSPSTKTRFLDVYMTGTNCTAGASQVVESICKAFMVMKTGSAGESSFAEATEDKRGTGNGDNHVEQVEQVGGGRGE